MKSLAQDTDLNILLTEVKKLMQAPSAGQSAPTSPSGFSSPIHGDWHNIGDFNLAMKRHHGGTGHTGIDMSCSGGTPVYSMGTGVVNKVGSNALGGNVVGIQHDKATWSYYAHLATITVQEGDKVNANTIIGTVGNSGNARSSWPHLHFGVKVNGSWVNPGQFFDVPKYDQAFASNPAKFGPLWISDKAKNDSMAFNINNYKKQDTTRIATQRIDAVLKMAEEFLDLSLRQ